MCTVISEHPTSQQRHYSYIGAEFFFPHKHTRRHIGMRAYSQHTHTHRLVVPIPPTQTHQTHTLAISFVHTLSKHAIYNHIYSRMSNRRDYNDDNAPSRRHTTRTTSAKNRATQINHIRQTGVSFFQFSPNACWVLFLARRDARLVCRRCLRICVCSVPMHHFGRARRRVVLAMQHVCYICTFECTTTIPIKHSHSPYDKYLLSRARTRELCVHRRFGAQRILEFVLRLYVYIYIDYIRCNFIQFSTPSIAAK